MDDEPVFTMSCWERDDRIHCELEMDKDQFREGNEPIPSSPVEPELEAEEEFEG